MIKLTINGSLEPVIFCFDKAERTKEMSFSFYMPVKIMGGKGVISKNSGEFKKYGGKCLIIFTGASAKLCGALDDVIAALEENGTEFETYDKISLNPKAEECCLAGRFARECKAEFIIGIGGGSALDAAKAAAVYAANESLSPEDIYSKPVSPPVPVILVGTTAGTGSEVTGVSVLTRANGKKKSVSGENYYARLALADPLYTYSVPYDVTVSTAVDAFSHAVESLFSNKAEFNSKSYAKKAIKPLWDCIRFFYENGAVPTDKMRDTLYYSSLYAGMALNLTGTCFPHTLGYTLTEDYAVPHGFACAVFLPEFVKRAMEFKKELAVDFLSEIGVSLPEFEHIVLSVIKTDGVKMTKKQISDYCQNWHNIKNFENTPGGFSVPEAEELLTKLFYKDN